MASIGHSLVVVLSSLLIAGSYSFPSLRLLFQDGVAGDSVKIHGLHTDSLLVATGQWEWKTAGEASHESPPLPRRKRETVFSSESSNKSALEKTTPGLQENETSQPFTVSTIPLWEEDESSHPGLAGNDSSTKAMATSSPARYASTESAVAHHNTVVGTAPLHGQMTTTSLTEDFTETEGPEDGSHSPHTMNTTQPTSMAASETSAATSAVSEVTLGPDLKSGAKTGGSTSSFLSPSMANSRPAPTGQTGPPSQGPDTMLRQCLLAISLLALVAAIFIITTFVLATLLLCQKRAYKLRQHNCTEMVCISSLLAAEEEEASRGRVPRTKRVKALPENGSEMDMDNLTLNSFLPDH